MTFVTEGEKFKRFLQKHRRLGLQKQLIAEGHALKCHSSGFQVMTETAELAQSKIV